MKAVTLFFIFNSLVILLLVNYSETYHEVPPNKYIEVVASDSYLFGIEEDFGDDPIVKCTYTTDTGINGSFVVGFSYVKPEAAELTLHNPLESYETRLEYNVIKNLGDQGLCQISVGNVNDTGPNIWTLTVTVLDINNQEVNLTDYVFNVQFFYRAPIVSYLVELLESASFYNHLTLPEDMTLTSCKLRVGEADMDLNLTSPEAPNVFLSPYSVRDDELAKRVTSLGRGLCGLTFFNVSKEGIWPEKWILTAGDDQKKFHRETFSTRVYSFSGILHRKRTVVVGTEFTLQCGQAFTQKFCTLFNPDGRTVYTRDCKHEIHSVTVEDLGEWKCYSGNANALESIEYVVELVELGPEYVEAWQNETSEYLHIGCRIGNHKGRTISHCRMTAPNERTFNIRPGVATERYIALGSDFNAAICSLKIAKPLSDEEKGKWRCEILLPYSEPVGAYIRVEQPTIPDYPKRKTASTQLGKKLKILCEVPYSSEYCNIRSPHGIIYPSDNAEEVTLGRCSRIIEIVNLTHNGTWTCSFAREIGIPDDEISVEVTVADVLSFPKSIEVDSGDSTNLICTSGGYSLLYCRFISPTGVSYHVKNHQNSSSISYYGDGIEYGDCGITIRNIQRSDQGFWTCVTRLFTDRDDPEISGQILLNVTPFLMDDTNVAGIGIGVAVGVVVLSAILGIIAMKRWKRRQHSEVEGTSTERRPADDGDTSSNNSETVFSRGPAPRSYTNPEPVRLELEDDDHAHQL